MHHPRIVLLVLFLACLNLTPELALAQASPFMTGATSLQTNARVAREYLVALPAEMSAEQQLKLARGFSHELADRYRFAVDLAIHEPRQFPGSDPRNFHAHLLATTREVGAQGLGAKTTLEWNDTRRRESGMGPAINELLHVRERWANVTNEALHSANLAARVDHRTLKDQGIDREPYPYIPRKVFEMERHGYRTVVGERLREDYQARVEARMARSRENQIRPKDAEDVRREAVKNWLRFRESASQGSGEEKAARGPEVTRVESASRGRYDDYSL
jgi:hypothetical protein